MTIRLQTLGVTVGLVLAALVVLYVWPTQWFYPSGPVVVGTQAVAVGSRVNRFTGKVEVLTIDGWKGPAPAAQTKK